MRTVLAFVLTPISLALVAAVLEAVAVLVLPEGLKAQASSVLQGVMAFIWSPIVAYPVAGLLGVPLYLLIRRFWRVTWWTCLLGGALSGLVGSVVVIAVEGGDFVTAYSVGIFAGMAAVGAVYGLVFWLMASWRRPSTRMTGQAPGSPLDGSHDSVKMAT